MYKITIVSRCQNKALKETRKIIDKFGLRTSDKTWNCNITNEGLQYLITKLRKTARKNTAIAIYYLKENKLRLYCIIGNKKEFGNDGACPVSVTTNKHISFYDKNIYKTMPYYKAIMEFIGYCHDLGKISGLFQEMLHSKKEIENKDVFRHEFLTVLILHYSNDKSTLKEKISNILNKYKSNSKAEEIKLFKIDTGDKILDFCCKVIVSHHKLPNLFSSNVSLNYDNYIRVDRVPNESTFKKLFCFFEDKTFKKILQRKNILFEKIKTMEKKFSDANLVFTLGHFINFRNALMLADHYISSRLKDETGTERILAKSKKNGYETLEQHLYSVGKMSSFIIENFTYFNNKFLSLNSNELESVLKSSCGAFIWQNKSCKTMLNISMQNDNCNLIILGAKTGSGKTRMALRLMTELNKEKELRLNVALGLRTLTTQTANSYREMLDVSDDMIALIVGENDFEIKEKEEDENSDNDLADEIFNDIDLKNGIIDNTLNSYILNCAKDFKSNIRTIKQQKIISTPIVISTIDYLIKGADWRKSKHLLPQLRLMSSDLIIDEIDMYCKYDLLHILRLIYLTGLFGRNIIVTTATISPVLADTISFIFRLGVSEYNDYIGNSDDSVNFHYLSDVYNESKIVNKQNCNENGNFFQEALKKSSKKMEDKQHKIKIIDNNGFCEDILENIIYLHFKNKCSYKKIAYSAGLIRIERIKDGFKMLRFLLEDKSIKYFEDRNIKVNYIFYHARLPLAVRKKIEIELDSALYRKGKNDPFVLSNIFKSNFDNNKADYTNYITIVVASPVEEVGRDHDFDWAIIEPSNSRSIIQTMGRVNRHRFLPIIDNAPNVFVLNNGFNDKNNSKDIRNNFSSLEDDSSAANIINPIDGELPDTENRELLKHFKKNDSFFGCVIDNEKIISQSLIGREWRKGEKTSEYRYDIEQDRFLQIDENNQAVKLNIKHKKLNNEEYCFLNSYNFDHFINDYEINDSSMLKIMVKKTEKHKDLFFSKTIGII